MWTDLKTVVRDGVLIGVKYAVALAIVLIAASWLLGDYATMRKRSLNGQIAWERQERVLQDQQRRAPAHPPTASPQKE